MKNFDKIFAVLILTWLLASCTNQTLDIKEWLDTQAHTWYTDWESSDSPKWWRWKNHNGENRGGMEEMKLILEKQKNGEELTSDEQLKIESIGTRTKEEKNNFDTNIEDFKNWDTNWNIIESDIDWDELSVDSKCIWCGHCVRFAPDNFTMSWRVAIVTSQDDIWSSDVSKAISRCPVDAISIS